MKPRTCVVVVNYRNAADTKKCVASIRESEVPAQVVVVDNSPGDPGLDEALAGFGNLEILRPDKNLGFAGGCNLGIASALADPEIEFVFLLNNDATVRPDTLSLLEGLADERGDAGVVTPRIVFMEDPNRLCYGRGVIDWRRGGVNVPGFGGSAISGHALLAGYVGFASGCAMLLRRAVLESVGGFDESYFMYEEDVDLSLRVLRAGFKIFYCPEALVLHRGHGSQRGDGTQFSGRWSADNPAYEFQIYHSVRNAVFNARKHARGRHLVEFAVIFPLLAFWRAAAASRKLGLRAFGPVVRGMLDGVRQPLKRLF